MLLMLASCATTPTAVARKTTCEIDVEVVTASYTGSASHPTDARKTLAEARAAACAALHAASPQTDCDDPTQVVLSTRTNFQSINGVVTQSAEVGLRRVVRLVHQRAEGTALDPLEVCRAATTKLCASVEEGLTCYQAGVDCLPVDENSTRCAPAERERARPMFGPR